MPEPAATILATIRMGHRLCVLLALVWFAGCTPRADLLPDAAALAGDVIVPIYVGTTRAQEAEGAWSAKTAGPLTYARVDVNVPKTGKPGIVALPDAHPDPDRHFLTQSVTPLAGRGAFRAEVVRALASGKIRGNEVVVTIHGFNNTMGEGVFRTAQMIRDFEIEALTLHYAWPSRGAPLGYAADRDAVLIARDGLEQMLEDLRHAGARKIVLVAHSMGAQLTMEVLRQMTLREDRATFSRISAVVLLSPDISPALFRAQAEAIGDLPDPFVIFTSQNDPALRLSARLTGVPRRLGNIRGVKEVAGLNVTVINLSSARDAGSNHLAALTSPSVISFLKETEAIRQGLEADASGRAGLLPGTMLLAQEATAIMLAPVALIDQGLR